MRVAIYQCEPRPTQVAANLERLAHAAGEAAARGAELLLCPEMFLTGYNIGPAAARRLAEPRDGDSARRVGRIALERRLAILYGYPERGSGDSVFNAAHLVGADGRSLGHYRKTHLFGDLDRTMFSASAAESPVIDLNGWQLGMLICYDVEFPENARQLALAGADLIAAPTANMIPYDVVATTIVPARAVENQVFVVAPGQIGEVPPKYNSYGRSMIVDPWGVVLATAPDEECFVAADLDFELQDRVRAKLPSLANRVPSAYQWPDLQKVGR